VKVIHLEHAIPFFFCWTPTTADLNSNPHCFDVTVYDNHCPYFGVQISQLCITVNNKISCLPTPVDYFESAKTFNLYPQPAADKLFFDLGDETVFKNGTINIIDLWGRPVYYSFLNENLFSIALNLPTGIYDVIISNESKTVNMRKPLIILKE
jgi:hypothetical protein